MYGVSAEHSGAKKFRLKENIWAIFTWKGPCDTFQSSEIDQFGSNSKRKRSKVSIAFFRSIKRVTTSKHTTLKRGSPQHISRVSSSVNSVGHSKSNPETFVKDVKTWWQRSDPWNVSKRVVQKVLLSTSSELLPAKPRSSSGHHRSSLHQYSFHLSPSKWNHFPHPTGQLCCFPRPAVLVLWTCVVQRRSGEVENVTWDQLVSKWKTVSPQTPRMLKTSFNIFSQHHFEKNFHQVTLGLFLVLRPLCEPGKQRWWVVVSPRTCFPRTFTRRPLIVLTFQPGSTWQVKCH